MSGSQVGGATYATNAQTTYVTGTQQGGYVTGGQTYVSGSGVQGGYVSGSAVQGGYVTGQTTYVPAQTTTYVTGGQTGYTTGGQTATYTSGSGAQGGYVTT